MADGPIGAVAGAGFQASLSAQVSVMAGTGRRTWWHFLAGAEEITGEVITTVTGRDFVMGVDGWAGVRWRLAKHIMITGQSSGTRQSTIIIRVQWNRCGITMRPAE